MQRRFGEAIEIAQQLALPVVPDAGADGADVGDGQHQQQAQALDVADDLGELRHRARIADVALLRHVAHHQVMAHQPGDQIDLLRRQAEALAGRARGLLALDLLVALALAGVVQQHGEIERARD